MTADAVRLFEHWRQTASPEIRSLMGFLLPVPLADYPSVQAADMFAGQKLAQYVNESAIFSGRIGAPPLCVPSLLNSRNSTEFVNCHWKRQDLIEIREKDRAVCPDDWI